MMDESLDLTDVLARLRRADESLAEFVAPCWPGVKMAAAWIEGQPRLFHLGPAPDNTDYYLFRIADEQAERVRPAEGEEIAGYLRRLTRAHVILLKDGLACPSSPVERLQGIVGPRTIHFSPEKPLAHVNARFDGLNLYYDCDMSPRRQSGNPLEELFGNIPASNDEELLNLDGEEALMGNAEKMLQRLQDNPDLADECRLTSVLETAGAVLQSWEREEGGFRVNWRRLDTVETVWLASTGAPIVAGISLAGARAFDPARLTRLLHEHILDGWRQSDTPHTAR